MVFIHDRHEVVDVASEETVVMVKAVTARPPDERAACRNLARRHMIPFSKCVSGVTLLLKDLGTACCLWRHDAIVTRKAHGASSMTAKADRMMVATGQYRRPRWRAKCRRMKVGVCQATCRKPVHVRSINQPAIGAKLTVAGVV